MSGQRKVSTVFYGILALGLTAAAGARAEGEFMRDAMSNIGLIEPERPAINYQERAPLVMPPNLGAKAPPAKAARQPGKGDKAGDKAARAEPRAAAPEMDPTLNLPVPRARGEADPQWPKDPEIGRRERAAIEDKKPITRGAQGRMNDNNETLSAYEMQGGRRAGAEIPTGPVVRPGDTRESTWLNPLELFTGRKAEAEPSVVEPEREGLTDPPNGYRKAPLKVGKTQGGPVGGSISGNEESDPRAYMRSQAGR